MTLKEEAEQLAKDRPTSLSDDLYQWAMDAEEMLWKLSAQAAQPAQNEWKEAVIEQLAAHSMDAPVSDSPTVILAKIIHMAVLQATDHAIKVAQPAHAHAIDTSPERVEKQAGDVQVPGWLPIESAPKDFVTEFDGWNGERVTNVSWAHPEYSPKGHYDWCVTEYEQHNGWVNEVVRGLTHWMPLPAAPSTKEGTI